MMKNDNKGAQKKHGSEDMMKELRTAYLTWEAAKRTAKDRRKWRTTVAEAR
jgi:hypothetical protein